MEVTTVLGNGVGGLSESQVNNPYGMSFGPDGWLYFCDVDNHSVRRLHLGTGRLSVIAGTGSAGYTGDGRPATRAKLAAPHEVAFDHTGHLYIAERDNHVIRRVDARTGNISTLAGTGRPGYRGDGGPAAEAQLRSPHSVAVLQQSLLICDIGNHRVRSIDLTSGCIETWAGTGEAGPTPAHALLRGTPLNGPRTLVVAEDETIYLALREGNAVYQIDVRRGTLSRIAGTGAQGYAGDGGSATEATFGGKVTGDSGCMSGPKGLALGDGVLYVVDTESHTIRSIDLSNGLINTVLGTGEAGDGPEPDPLRCRLNRPHSALYIGGSLYVADSESHRIRQLS